MLYELRIYAIPPGRMAEIQDRILTAVPPLFRAHGIRPVGHWSALAGPRLPSFVYLLAWDDAAHRDAAWESFTSDERWWRIRRDSNAGSELVETYALLLMKENKRWTEVFPVVASAGPNEIHDFVIQDAAIGHVDAVADHVMEDVLPIFRAAGARVLTVADIVTGPTVPLVAYFLAWTSYADRTSGWTAYFHSPALRAARQSHLTTFQRPLLGKSDVFLLQPVAAQAAP